MSLTATASAVGSSEVLGHRFMLNIDLEMPSDATFGCSTQDTLTILEVA
jgi:hypothetical protein